MGYYWGNQMNAGTWWPFMGFVMVIFFVTLIVALIALLRYREHLHHPHAAVSPRTSSAIAILQERLARGEINEDEYRARLKLLRETHPE